MCSGCHFDGASPFNLFYRRFGQDLFGLIIVAVVYQRSGNVYFIFRVDSSGLTPIHL